MSLKIIKAPLYEADNKTEANKLSAIDSMKNVNQNTYNFLSSIKDILQNEDQVLTLLKLNDDGNIDFSEPFLKNSSLYLQDRFNNPKNLGYTIKILKFTSSNEEINKYYNDYSSEERKNLVSQFYNGDVIKSTSEIENIVKAEDKKQKEIATIGQIYGRTPKALLQNQNSIEDAKFDYKNILTLARIYQDNKDGLYDDIISNNIKYEEAFTKILQFAKNAFNAVIQLKYKSGKDEQMTDEINDTIRSTPNYFRIAKWLNSNQDFVLTPSTERTNAILNLAKQFNSDSQKDTDQTQRDANKQDTTTRQTQQSVGSV